MCYVKDWSNLCPFRALHHQFNTQQLYALPTLYLCVLYLSEKKTATCATYSIN
jgi:hypothetical protein